MRIPPALLLIRSSCAAATRKAALDGRHLFFGRRFGFVKENWGQSTAMSGTRGGKDDRVGDGDMVDGKDVTLSISLRKPK